jgi:predicted nucleotidyltransferase
MDAVSVDDRFKALIARISMSQAEMDSFERHRQSVTQAVRRAFNTNRVSVMGSFARGSSLGGISDLDLLCIVEAREARWGGRVKDSRTVLNKVRECLQESFAETGIGRDGQAVLVAFANGKERVDVVPAFFHRFEGRHPVYLIPSGNGGWLETSPSAHEEYIEAADYKSGGKLKYVSILLKYFREQRGLALNSFHCELLLAQEGVCDGIGRYAQCFADALVLLARRQCRDLQDPLRISGNVFATNTEPQRQQAVTSISRWLQNALAAFEAEARRDSPEAYRNWDLVFNGAFPKA